MFLIVLQKSGEHLFVESHVPFVRVVVKLMILLLLVLLRALYLHVALQFESTGRELYIASSCKRLGEVGPGIFHVGTLLVELCKLVEVYLVDQVVGSLGCVLPCAKTGFVLALQVDDAYRVDTFVHAEGVLPVVGRAGILAVVLDSYSLVGTHVLLHHFLLHATNLCTWSILGIAHGLDAIAGEVALCCARIAHGHGVVAILIALQRNLCPTLGFVRHVVLAVGCRTIGLRIGINAEYREVASLAGPHPVVCITAKLTHRLRHGEH